MEVGYGIHRMADDIVQFATEPTVVTLEFVGNTQKRYSFQCATEGSPDLALEYFEYLLKTNDWYYQYSDDHRAYSAGRSSHQLLMSVKNVLESRGISTDELYTKYLPQV